MTRASYSLGASGWIRERTDISYIPALSGIRPTRSFQTGLKQSIRRVPYLCHACHIPSIAIAMEDVNCAEAVRCVIPSSTYDEQKKNTKGRECCQADLEGRGNGVDSRTAEPATG